MDNRLIAAAYSITIFTVVAAIGAYVLAQVGTQMVVDSPAYNVTVTGTAGISSLVGWLPVLVVAAVAGIVLSYFLTGGFGTGMGGEKR